MKLLIIWAIIFYLIYKFVRGFAYLSVKRSSGPATPNRPQPTPKQNNRASIDQKDIVEAEFEEIKNPNE
ncbi:MAG: hypothetical protein Q8S39_15235 [Ignavibacteria bacterium]|nr:hypothetical protein [Ignavibacteria bacterium]